MIEQTAFPPQSKTELPAEGETVNATARRSVAFAEAFRFWLKLGFISFGGPAGQIAIMHRELVENRHWISEERFLHALNYCMLLPGPEAQQLAIYIGWLLHRNRGGIVAGVFFVLPSVFLLLALSYIYAAYGNVPAIIGILSGFKPIVVAVVVEAVLKIGGRALKSSAHFAIAAFGFIAIFFLHVPFPLIVLAAGVIGFAGTKYLPRFFEPRENAGAKTSAKSKKNSDENLRIAIDDDAPQPPHTLPSRARLLRVLAVGLVLWAIPFLALIFWRGADGIHAQEYRFFTQAALVTFGGAYAVLGYVTQTAVADYNWLTPAQAVDGLALAETTPGPLIIVLQFIGFIAVWNTTGGAHQFGDAVLGALLTTYVTFLPSFIFIFAGAPYIEILRGNQTLTGVLSGITAAVVGVVLNLTIIFGAAVIFPQGLTGKIEWLNAAMSIAAFILLYRYKINILWIIAAGGLFGLGKVVLFG